MTVEKIFSSGGYFWRNTRTVVGGRHPPAPSCPGWSPVSRYCPRTHAAPQSQHKASPVPEPPASSQHSGYVAVGCAVAGNRLSAFSLPLSLRPKTTLLLTEGTSAKIFDKGTSIRKLQPLLLEEV